MKLGFIGLPNSGKTTVFNAITGNEAEVGYLHRQVINKAIVEVPDYRILELEKKYNPLKTTFAGIEVYDFAKSEEDKENEYFNCPEAKLLDALAAVVRCFDDEVINIEYGEPNPRRDIGIIQNELILGDLLIAEKRLEKVKLNLKRGVKTAVAIAEEKVLEKITEALHNEVPIRDIGFSAEEQRIIRSFQFLTNRPVVIVLNTDETHLSEAKKLAQELYGSGIPAFEIAGKFEMELMKLDECDAEMFIKDLGYGKQAKERIIEAVFIALEYVHFFTVGQQEVRAWTIKKGCSAPEAAGKIHSDMEKGFIKAECFHYDDLTAYGNEKTIKEKGKFRLEGKNYIVKDGDILIIRFSN